MINMFHLQIESMHVEDFVMNRDNRKPDALRSFIAISSTNNTVWSSGCPFSLVVVIVAFLFGSVFVICFAFRIKVLLKVSRFFFLFCRFFVSLIALADSCLAPVFVFCVLLSDKSFVKSVYGFILFCLL